jgi:coiled-coil domain-containing protein 63/114
MDTYKRNVQIIEDAFEQIKESTGISSTEEIVTTFIKAEE